MYRTLAYIQQLKKKKINAWTHTSTEQSTEGS